MKPKVDQDLCIGCALCEDTCPAVFRIESDGYSHVIDEDPPAEQQDCVREAADICPTEAISIQE